MPGPAMEEQFGSLNLATEDGGILSDVQARHGHSAQPESQQVMAVLRAVLEVIAAQGLSPSPTAIFAAIMSALEKPETQASAQVVAAMATLLDLTLPRVPNAVLRSKFNCCCQILTSVLQQHSTQAHIARSLLGCLGALLAAAEPSAWLAAAGPWALLLGSLTDGRPKVRKAAAKAATEVLAAYQVAGPVLLGAASDALAGVCGTVLPGPAAAARAAAAASNKQRSAAEAAITAAVGDALHLLGALRSLLSLVSAPAASAIVDQCLKLYSLRQPLLSRHTSDALSTLLVSPGCRLPPAQVSTLLTALLDTESAAATGASSSSSGGSAQQQEAAAALSRALEAGLRRLGAAGGDAAAQAALLALLPRVVHALVAQLGSASEGGRWGAATALKELLRDLVGPPLIEAAAQRQAAAAAAAAGGGGAPGRRGGLGSNPLSSVVVGVGAALGPRYMEAWTLALPVAGVLLEALGAEGAGLARPLIAQLGTLLDGQEAAAEEEEAAAAASGQQVSGPSGAGRGGAMEAAVAALGVALRSQGPDVVLEVLPLQLKEGLAGTAQPRTWLLPLLRRYVRGAPLASWTTSLLPLARSMGAAAASASAAGRKPLALSCHTLELQCWAALPAYASWPSDAATAYPALVKELAAAAHTRPDFRPAIGAALGRLALQPRGVLVAAGRLEGLPASAAEEARAAGRRKRAAAAAGASEALDSEDEDGTAAAAGGGDDDDDDVPSTSGRGSQKQQQMWGDGGAPPPWYTPEMAAAQLAALAPTVDKWMRLLAKLYVESDPEARAPLGDALGALARIAPPPLLLGLFKVAADKLARVMREAGAALPPPDPLLEGGATPGERAATFLELMLALGPGLVEGALGPLAQAARQQVLGSDASLQKKGYKVLAWLAEQRPGWLETATPELLTLLLTTSTKTASSARRFRLRLLRPLILLLEAPGGDACPQLTLPEGNAGAAELASPDAAVRQAAVLRALVGELVLGIKEINVKTRTAAYELLLELAHELDEARPPSLGLSGADSDMEEEEYGAPGSAQQWAQPGASSSGSGGGLMDFVQLVLGGVVGATPHMQSAAVMALARLTYEFAGALEGVVPQLLPAILLLLRSNSREVVRSVLGYLKVCAMRMPVDVLLPWLGPMQEGMLLWAEDSKNKFRLKVRLILERLVRRCGVEAVAAVTPAQDARLLIHIRKQAAAKERRRAASRSGSQAGDLEADDARSQRSAVTRDSKARTARASEWGHTKIFSEGGSDDQQQQQQQHWRQQQQGGPGSVKSGRSRGGGAGGVSFMEEGEEPMDLLEAGSSRQLSRQAAGQRAAAARQRQASAADAALPHAADGRLMIEDEEAKGRDKALRRSKRAREEGWLGDSDDSDMDDMRSFAGLSAAMKSVANAKSVRFAPSIAASLAGKSKAGSIGGKSSAGGRSAQHSGERFKPKKAGTGGDVGRSGGVEPYAYWQLDRKMLNRRRGKQASASKGLAGVVRGAAAGVAKGGKARRAQQAAKRVKRQ